MINNVSGIYKITNKINNKMYIGSSKNMPIRLNQHLKDLIADKHHSYKLQNDFNEFGIDVFTFEIIRVVNNESELKDIEQKYMDDYKCYEDNIGYNVSISAKEKKTKLDLQIEQEKEKGINNIVTKNKNPKIKVVKQKTNPFCESDNEIIRAIVNHDVEFLKNKINYKETYYELKDDCLDEIYKYDFSWFFENLTCIFCGKSFEIKLDKDDNYKYFCDHNCWRLPLNILHVIELIGMFKPTHLAKKFLLNIFNIKYNEEFSRKYEIRKIREMIETYKFMEELERHENQEERIKRQKLKEQRILEQDI